VDRGLAVLLTAVFGGLVALQPPINSMLGRAVGDLQSAAISFAVGTLILLVLVAIIGGGFGQMVNVRDVSLFYVLAGGALGAAYVTTVLVTVRALGAAGVVAITIFAQLALTIVVDHFGWLGVTRNPISALRVIGVVLLALGTYLVIRE
jgi:transporter family-2 protein